MTHMKGSEVKASDPAGRRQPESGVSTSAKRSIHPQNLPGSMDFFFSHASIISDSSDSGSVLVPGPSIPINTGVFGGSGSCVVA